MPQCKNVLLAGFMVSTASIFFARLLELVQGNVETATPNQCGWFQNHELWLNLFPEIKHLTRYKNTTTLVNHIQHVSFLSFKTKSPSSIQNSMITQIICRHYPHIYPYLSWFKPCKTQMFGGQTPAKSICSLFFLHVFQPCKAPMLKPYGGFIKLGSRKWMVCHGKCKTQMDDDWGYLFRKKTY